MVPTSILKRTFYIKYQIYTGTAFTFEKGDKQYLATTSHTFPFTESGDAVDFSIMQNNVWVEYKSKIFKHSNKTVDIAILALPNDISQRYPINLTIGGLLLSHPAFFLGFPFGKFMQDTSYINSNFPFPYVKHGIFSTIPFKEKDLELFYVDGINNPGFSGGPCLFMRSGDTTPNVCGIIKGYLPHVIDVKTPIGEYTFEENSGLIEVHSIRHLFEISLG